MEFTFLENALIQGIAETMICFIKIQSEIMRMT